MTLEMALAVSIAGELPRREDAKVLRAPWSFFSKLAAPAAPLRTSRCSGLGVDGPTSLRRGRRISTWKRTDPYAVPFDDREAAQPTIPRRQRVDHDLVVIVGVGPVDANEDDPAFSR